MRRATSFRKGTFLGMAVSRKRHQGSMTQKAAKDAEFVQSLEIPPENCYKVEEEKGTHGLPVPLPPPPAVNRSSLAPKNRQPRGVSVRFSQEVDVQQFEIPDSEVNVDHVPGWVRKMEHNEYIREAKFFQKVSRWAMRDPQAHQLYEKQSIDHFLPARRADQAFLNGIESYQELVKSVGKFVNKKLYAPTKDELHVEAVRTHTEEILTSLVADRLQELFHYEKSTSKGMNELYHDTFHLSRSISWRRQAYIDKMNI